VDDKKHLDGVDIVAIILAAGLTILVLAIVVGAIINITTAFSGTKFTATLSENVTQVLTAAIGGLIGVLGSYIGFRARPRHKEEQ
jgi:hypothetical protein